MATVDAPDNPYVDIANVDHDPDLAAALGNVMIVWAYAETAMVMALARLTSVGANRATRAYYRIPTFESRVKFIRILVSTWDNASFDKKAIDRAIIKLSGLSRTRNHWVHSVWAKERDGTRTLIFDFRAEENTPDRQKFVKAHDVNNHVSTVKKRADELYSAVKTHQLPP